MKHKYDIVALGDINLDYVVANNLSFPFSSLKENGIIYWEEINEVPGGSALNFCVYAKEAGYESLLLSKIGSDVAGEVIATWLRQNKIDLSSTGTINYPTGKALIMRDKSDIRLLVNNKTNANHFLDQNDINENKAAIAACRVLYISGYNISEIQMPRYGATLQAMEYAKSTPRPPVVVFDVVPHRIYEKLTFDQFQDCTKNVDILISEVATARRFLGLGSKSETIDKDMAKDTANRMSEYYGKLILRYGASGCDKQILLNKGGGQFSLEETGHNLQADKRGFGDKLTIRALRDFFGVL
jgi:sugar/nucleoside kinase (ribokinase family)